MASAVQGQIERIVRTTARTTAKAERYILIRSGAIPISIIISDDVECTNIARRVAVVVCCEMHVRRKCRVAGRTIVDKGIVEAASVHANAGGYGVYLRELADNTRGVPGPD